VNMIPGYWKSLGVVTYPPLKR